MFEIVYILYYSRFASIRLIWSHHLAAGNAENYLIIVVIIIDLFQLPT